MKILALTGSLMALAAVVIVTTSMGQSSLLQGRMMVLDDAAAADTSSESLRHYLRASPDSIAYSCGGKEVAETCLLATETCLSSMQKKVKYTVRQSIAKDMATCSCFQANGCSASCNAAMMSIFGGYMTVASCPLDIGSVYTPLSSVSPYDFYGEDSFGYSSYGNPEFLMGTAGMFRGANGASSQVLAQIPEDELVLEVPVAAKMLRGRKM